MLRQLTRIMVFSLITVTTMPQASSQVGDFNGDTVLDCQDLNHLYPAVDAGTNDPRFDLNGDQRVDDNDLSVWLSETNHDWGSTYWGDANFDYRVDHLDLNIVGINWLSTTAGYCQGDFTGDRATNTGDDDVVSSNYNPPPDFSANVVNHPLPGPLDAWREDNGVVFAETEHFQLVSMPQTAQDGLLATVLAVRTKDPAHRVATLYRLAAPGDLHQVWPGPFGGVATPTVERVPSLSDDGQRADSHILFGRHGVGANAACGLGGAYEDNDHSDPIGLDEQLQTDQPMSSGIGGIVTPCQPLLFSLDLDLQDNFVELVQLVTPAVMADTGARGEVFFRGGILGADENNLPLPDEGVIGLDEPIAVPFFPEPCDFDGDGRCDTADLDELLAGLGMSNAALDLVSDGTLNLDDRDEWLRLAGEEKVGQPFVVGDTDLDGDVDASDLNNLALHWLSTGGIYWGDGDFNGDRTVNAVDLNGLALNWSHGLADNSVGTVPEPDALTLFLISAFVMTGSLWRQTPRGGCKGCSVHQRGAR